jgi:hypothetical protein
MYTKEWYLWMSETSYNSSRNMLGPIFNALGFIPRSIIDIGGGAGGFLSAFYEAGIKDVAVIDGDWVKDSIRYLPDSCFIYHDLTQPYYPTRKYDMAICCEVIEHIDDQHSDIVLDAITRCSDVCLWSAALPGQGGTHHVNEREESYWEEKFLNRGFIKFDILRNQLTDFKDDKIAHWYRQNIMVYAR